MSIVRTDPYSYSCSGEANVPGGYGDTTVGAALLSRRGRLRDSRIGSAESSATSSRICSNGKPGDSSRSQGLGLRKKRTLERWESVLLWHLAETRERVNRANPGKERCLGNSIGRVRLFHQHVGELHDVRYLALTSDDYRQQCPQ